MKETGIIMSGNHPRLILEGMKTQTRRVIKPQPVHVEVCSGEAILYKDHDNEIAWKYRVGDRLWVKETWATENRYNHLKPSEIPQTAKIFYLADGYDPFEMGIVRPSIFMPRWASRILLEITELRAERLQEITNEDAKAEGVTPMTCCLPAAAHYITPFKELWDSLNFKKYPWVLNPWVWCISFRIVNT